MCDATCGIPEILDRYLNPLMYFTMPQCDLMGSFITMYNLNMRMLSRLLHSISLRLSRHRWSLFGSLLAMPGHPVCSLSERSRMARWWSHPPGKSGHWWRSMEEIYKISRCDVLFNPEYYKLSIIKLYIKYYRWWLITCFLHSNVTRIIIIWFLINISSQFN
jgi:hypothetical protein